jgi:hypothetical protein
MPHRRDVAPYSESRLRERDDVPRDPNATHCRGCGLPYVPERPMTIAEALLLPAQDCRTEPAA